MHNSLTTTRTCTAIILILASCLMCGCSVVSPFNYEDRLSVWHNCREDAYRAAVANNFTLARQKYQSALSDAAKFGTSSSFMLTSLNELASFYQENHQLEQSQQLYEQALSICLKRQKDGSSSTVPTGTMIATLLNLANLYRDENKVNRAEPLYKIALIANRSGLFNVRPSLRESQILLDYAKLLKDTGRRDEAKGLETDASRMTGLPFIFPSASKQLLKLLVSGELDATPVATSGPPWLACTVATNRAMRRRDFAEATRQAKIAVREAEKFGPDDVRLANALTKLAVLEWNHEEEEPLLRRALNILESTVGAQDKETKACSFNLANCYMKKQKPDLAGPLLIKLSDSRDQTDSSPGSILLSPYLQLLGDYYGRKNDDPGALQFYLRALPIAESTPAVRTGVPSILISIASVYRALNNWDKAKEFARRGIVAATEANDKLLMPFALREYALSYWKAHQYPEAESFLVRAIAAADKWKSDSDEVIGWRLELANLYAERKKYKDQHLVSRQALSTPEKLPPGRPPSVVQVLNPLPWMLYGQKRKGDAEGLVERAILLNEKERPHDPRTLWWWQDSQARMYLGDNLIPQAEGVSKQLIALAQEIRPENPGLVARSLNELAIACYLQGRSAEAISLQKQAISQAERSKDPYQAIFWQLQFAQWLFDHEDLVPAEMICKLVLSCAQKIKQPQRVQALILLASSCARQEDYGQSGQLLQQAFDLINQAGEPDDWSSAELALVQLDKIYSSGHRINPKLGKLRAKLDLLQNGPGKQARRK